MADEKTVAATVSESSNRNRVIARSDDVESGRVVNEVRNKEESCYASSIQQVPSDNGGYLVEYEKDKPLKKDEEKLITNLNDAKVKDHQDDLASGAVGMMNDDGSLLFYMLDAHEEPDSVFNRGNIFLFGKVKEGKLYHSCCVIVKNIQRCVYAIPAHPLQCSDEKDAHEKLQPVMNEIAKHLLDMKVSTFSMAPVKRKYSFDQSENYVVQINYPFKDPVLPADLKGEGFCALSGTHCSALELFLVHREIKEGPSWLQVSNFSDSSGRNTWEKVSWCKVK